MNIGTDFGINLEKRVSGYRGSECIRIDISEDVFIDDDRDFSSRIDLPVEEVRKLVRLLKVLLEE